MTEPAKPRMRDGQAAQKWVKGGRTRKEAESARDEARNREGNRGGWKAPSRLLLGEYLAGTWLPSVKAKVAPSTFTSYRQNITHVANRIGHVRLDALDPPTLDALYADLEAGGLARSTVRLLHTQLHRAWPMRSAGICAMAGRRWHWRPWSTRRGSPSSSATPRSG